MSNSNIILFRVVCHQYFYWKAMLELSSQWSFHTCVSYLKYRPRSPMKDYQYLISLASRFLPNTGHRPRLFAQTIFCFAMAHFAHSHPCWASIQIFAFWNKCNPNYVCASFTSAFYAPVAQAAYSQNQGILNQILNDIGGKRRFNS